MVSEEVKFNTGVNSVNGSSNAASTQSAGAGKSDYTNTVFDEFKKRAIKQGVELTLEDFQKFLNENPDLSLKTPEEQNALFNKFLAAGKTEEPQKETPAETIEQTSQSEVQTEQSTTTETIESTTGQTETTKSEQTQSANLFAKTKTEETETPTTTKTTNSFAAAKSGVKTAGSKDDEKFSQGETFTQKEDGLGYDSVKFSKMEPEMQAKSYVYEYAKNKFLYSDSTNPKDPAEWDKLSREEQFKLVQACSKEIEEDYQRAFEARTGKKAEGVSSDYIKLKMLELQAASNRGVTMEKFNNESSVAKAAYVADMLSVKEQICPDRMSDVEKMSLEKANFILDACKDELKRLGKEDKAKGLCFEDIAGYAHGEGKIEFSMGTAIKNKLASIPENQRTDAQKAAMEFLGAVPDKYLNDFGINLGEPTGLDKEIQGDKDFAARYDAAKSPAQRAQIKVEYYKAKYADKPEQIKTFMEKAIKSGDVDEIQALLKLTKNNEKLQEQLVNSDGSVQVVTAAGVDNFSDTNTEKYTQKVAEGEKNDPKRVGAILQKTVENIKNYGKKSQLIAALHGSNQVENPENAKLVKDWAHQTFSSLDEYKEFLDGASAEVTTEITSTAYEAPKGIQAEVANIGLKHKDENIRKRVAKNINHSESVNKFDVSQQKQVLKSVKTVFENDLPKDEAVKELNKLSDQISKCHKDNQLAMHEEISSSKYAEVVEHAAQNISTYDESVQAKALKVTYEKAAETGNIAAIQAATAQVENMAPAAVKAMAAEIKLQIAILEERGIKMALDEIKSAIGMSTDKTDNSEKTQIQKYIEELSGLPRSEVYRRIVSDIRTYPTHIQQLLLEAIVKTKGELFTMMINKYGIDMLTMFGNMSSIMKSEILKEMLKTPSMQADAMAYIDKNPTSNYSSGVKDLYNEIIADRQGASSVEELERKADKEIKEKENNYATLSFGAQSGSNRTNLTSITDVADKYGFYTRKDILGRVGLIS